MIENDFAYNPEILINKNRIINTLKDKHIDKKYQ